MPSFSEILGQEKAIRILQKAISREMIPHAYLFSGIPGIGKTSVAAALSMALNCTEPINGDGCGKCRACRQMLGGNFPDFFVVLRESNSQFIKVDQIREINRWMGFAPLSRYRVCVLSQAERMNAEAANAFLKTLEEPPPGNILILNTTEPRDLLPTIVSRCQKVNFQPLSLNLITDWLMDNMGVNRRTANVAAAVSQGSLGRARDLCEEEFLKKREEWIERIEKLTMLSSDHSFLVAAECGEEAKKMNLENEESGEIGLLRMMDVWKLWYRDLLFTKLDSQNQKMVNSDFVGKLKKFAESFTINNLIESIWAVDKAQRDLTMMRNTRLVIEYTAMKLNRLAKAGN